MSGKNSWAVVPRDEAPGEPVPRSRGARMAVLIGPQHGAGRFFTRRFTLAPGGAIPEHRHDTVEHQQVVVRAGDAVFIPAGTAHAYANRAAEEVEFVCIVPATADYQTQWLGEPPAGAWVGEDTAPAGEPR